MTKREQHDLQIENLIYKLNQLAQQRKDCFDRLWTLETEAEQMRVELLNLLEVRRKYGN